MPPNPAERNRALDTGAELFGAAASRQKRLVDPFDIDAAILHRLDVVRDLDQLARGASGSAWSFGADFCL